MTVQPICEIPLLPLPETVLFPRTLAPVRVSEKRHKQLIAYALENRKEVGVALLQPGWEAECYGAPEVFPTGGLGIVSERERLGAGEWRILLQGLQRFNIVEFTQMRPYRIARVRLLDDLPVAPQNWETRRLSRQLVRYFKEMSEATGPASQPVHLLRRLDFPALVNSVCASLNFSVYEKQRLLELNDMLARAHSILEILRNQVTQLRLISRFRHLEPRDSRVN
jgi:Lon protease-like protein